MMVISLVESVWSARCVRSKSKRVRPIRSVGLEMSFGGSTSTLGFGFLAQLSSLTMRCSNSRTLVRYSSSLSRSSPPSPVRRDFACARTSSRMLRPSSSRRSCSWTSLARPSRNSWANTLDGELSAGMSAPVRVQERPPDPSPDRARLGKRVREPRCSAAAWSSEIALRKPGRPAPGTPVRKLADAWWPKLELMPACSRPEMTVN